MAHWFGQWTRRRLPELMARLGLLLAVLAYAPAAFALDNVTLVLSEEGPAYTEVADKIRQVLGQKNGPKVETLSLQVFLSRQGELAKSGSRVVVAVGLAAAQAASSLDSRVPVLSVLVPRTTFEALAREHGRQGDSRSFSAIYLDQPFSRQLQLIRFALPERSRVGVLAGAVAAEQLPLLQAAGKGGRLKINVEKVGRADDVIPILRQLLRDSDVLLAVPDPLVYNRNTIQGLLLTTYRYQIPVIGFSLSYVRAGALVAVYSVPPQIGQQVGEMLLGLAGDKTPALPPPQYPKYFSVSVNYQVARSMGIEVDNEAVLYDKIRRAGEQEP